MKSRNFKNVTFLLILIFAVGLIPKAVEKYVMSLDPRRDALDDHFMAGGRLGGPFHRRSPESGKDRTGGWSNGSGFILKGPLPPL